MSPYKPPLNDIFFSLKDVNGYPEHYAALGNAVSFDYDDLQNIIPEIGKFSTDILAPANAEGDKQGVRFERGDVFVPECIKQAYYRYIDAGWSRLAQPEALGGVPAPFSAKVVTGEMLQGANQAWFMYPFLNDGSIKALTTYADKGTIDRYVPKLVSGEWLGTMCLTEPHCGSDLNLLKVRAEPLDDGSYAIHGTKIFISGGEQDITDNIVHLVLARLPGAPEGTAGISLFVVPKNLVNDDGSLGGRNQASCISVEDKMGLKASATCAMAFEGARGWLVGAPHRGLQAMFVMINKSRIAVGHLAVGQIQCAHRVALEYAHERRAGKSPYTDDPCVTSPDPLVSHPDVRRMLMSQKAIAEGGRAFVHWCGKYVDLSDLGDDDQRRKAELRLGLLTPVVKGCLSEWASEMIDYGIQVLGGHGYVSDWGIEQRLRDVRVSRIYEGTTGIQGLDLLQRKILGASRGAFFEFLDEMEVEAGTECPATLQDLQSALVAAIQHLRQVTLDCEGRARSEKALVPSIAVDYLMATGYVVLAHMWFKAARAADRQLRGGASSARFYQAKLETADFYFKRLLPRTLTHYALIEKGADGLEVSAALDLPAD